MKRLMRDLAVLLAAALLALGLDRLGALSAVAAVLEVPAAEAEAEAPPLWPGESSAYLPPAPAPRNAEAEAPTETEEAAQALSAGDLRSGSRLTVAQPSLLREGWS